MSTGIGISTAHSVVEPSSRTRLVAGAVVVLYALLTMIPLVWIILTGFKTPPDSISYPPKVLFTPSPQGYCNLFTTRSRQTPEYIASLPPPTEVCDKVAREDNMVVAGRSNYIPRFVNSLIIAFGSTVLSVGIVATSIFCLIFAWNEYAFAVLLTSGTAQTAPPFIPIIIGEGGQDWPAVAAGTTLFLVPILVFTILLRKHLLRGITFGAVRK